MWFFASKDKADKDLNDRTVTREAIERAYKRREKDLESLRQYDRGEKDIHAPNFRDLVSRVRGAL